MTVEFILSIMTFSVRFYQQNWWRENNYCKFYMFFVQFCAQTKPFLATNFEFGKYVLQIRLFESSYAPFLSLETYGIFFFIKIEIYEGKKFLDIKKTRFHKPENVVS